LQHAVYFNAFLGCFLFKRRDWPAGRRNYR